MNNSSNDPRNGCVPELRNTVEFFDIKPAVISAIFVFNVITNSLVIAVIARYPQLRDDHTTLFTFSLSVSDLAAGCTFMPTSAALCSRATPGVAETTGILPKIHAFTMWWFGFNSMHSLCWLTISKTIVILKPLRYQILLTRKRCYVIIVLQWIIGGVFASAIFKMNITWNSVTCIYRFPDEQSLTAIYLVYFMFAVVVPTVTLVYGTMRIIIVVVRTHRQISALKQSVASGCKVIGNSGYVTAQAVRSSKNVIVICVASLVLNSPLIVSSVVDKATEYPISRMVRFLIMWVFEFNTCVNSLLYLILYRSVRAKTVKMFSELLAAIRDRLPFV